MFFLSQMCWPCLLASLAIGAVVGALTWSRLRDGRDEWRTWAAFFLFGAVIAALRILPGRTGMWLETALLFLATYLLGCVLGGWLRGVLGRSDGGPILAAAGAPLVIAAEPLRELAEARPPVAPEQVEADPEPAVALVEVEAPAPPEIDEPEDVSDRPGEAAGAPDITSSGPGEESAAETTTDLAESAKDAFAPPSIEEDTPDHADIEKPKPLV
jgi:hypothetical protein